jgi:hypothetical protein
MGCQTTCPFQRLLHLVRFWALCDT